MHETALWIPSGANQHLGILSSPKSAPQTGVLVLVGGPQYRVGSHRQFVLLARALAAQGYAALRFDFAGMGDSPGGATDFAARSSEIRAAIDAIFLAHPSLKRVVLWGLCDAASAALIYINATRDRRVAGLSLLNPWVRSEASLARTHVKHYYWTRMGSADFWKKLVSGRVAVFRSFVEFFRKTWSVLVQPANVSSAGTFQDAMTQGAQAFSGPVLVVLSENDLTAQEFLGFCQSNPRMGDQLGKPNFTIQSVKGADHTFSSRKWRQEVEQGFLEWLGRHFS